jgi:hypothetical protein
MRVCGPRGEVRARPTAATDWDTAPLGQRPRGVTGDARGREPQVSYSAKWFSSSPMPLYCSGPLKTVAPLPHEGSKGWERRAVAVGARGGQRVGLRGPKRRGAHVGEIGSRPLCLEDPAQLPRDLRHAAPRRAGKSPSRCSPLLRVAPPVPGPLGRTWSAVRCATFGGEGREKLPARRA